MIFSLLMLIVIVSCGPEQVGAKQSRKFDYSDVSVKSGSYYRMVNCFRSGSQQYFHYDQVSRRFIMDSLKRNIPSPYNVGVIAAFDEGISKQPEVILLSTGADVGDVLEFIPLGVLKYVEGDSNNFVILGLPVDDKRRTIEVQNFPEFITRYDEVKFFVQEWWLSSGEMNKQFAGWGDENEAIRKLDYFLKNNPN